MTALERDRLDLVCDTETAAFPSIAVFGPSG
jgi:hypothetical protein